MERLTRLFRPKSIAVIGGGEWCSQVILQCQKIGFEGDLWAIHPTKDDMAGLTPFRKVAELPAAPDAVFIGVNRQATIGVVAELAQMGAGGAICFASGFSEAAHEVSDGDDLQVALLDAAGEMPVIGPNCYGFLNYLDGVTLWPDQHGGILQERGVAIIAQSSNIAINLTMQARGLPIGYVVTVGNQAQTGLSEIGQALLADPRVTALGLHIEGIDDLEALVALSKRAKELGKPIIALKVGKSAQAQQAAISHTASLSGSDAGASALFDRLGIGRVSSLSALLETLKLLHVVGPLSSARIASMSCSGGEASLIADMAEGSPLTFPRLMTVQEERLRDILGPIPALSNPLDYHTFIWGDEDAMAATFATMSSGAVALSLVVLDFPRPDRCTSPAWDLVLNAAQRAQSETGRPIAIVSSLVENLPEAVATQLIGQGIIPFCGMQEAIEAISVAARIGQPDANERDVHIPPPIFEGNTLTEAEAKAALAAYGVVVPRSVPVQDKGGLAMSGARIGYPLVLKGEGIAHKTEAGAVVIGLRDEAALLAAAERMPTDRFLVEELVSDASVELLVGVVLDPAHGYVLTLAAGGTLTELLQDSVSMTVPATADEIAEKLGTLRLAALLDGYRGAAPVNKAAIVEAVRALQTYVIAHHPFEVEINPLLCGPTRAVAVDALIKTGDRHD